MNYKPMQNRVIIKRLVEKNTTDGGIYIPGTVLEKPDSGTVIAVGPGKITDKGVLIPMEVEPFNIVLFAKGAGSEVKLDGEDYLVMREDDIIGVVEL